MSLVIFVAFLAGFCSFVASLECYECDSVESPDHCNLTRICGPNTKCYSTGSSGTSFTLGCTNTQECQRPPEHTLQIVGRSGKAGRQAPAQCLECCPTDLCNQRLCSQAYKINCTRDIVVLLEDSTNKTSTEYFKQFLRNLVSSIAIGRRDNKFEIATFHNSINSVVHFRDSQNEDWLLDSISNLSFTHQTDSIDYNEIIRVLAIDLDPSRRKANRFVVPDFVIIVADHALQSDKSVTIATRQESIGISSAAWGIVVVTIGPDATNYSPLTQLATSSDYVFNLNDYTDLLGLNNNLLPLICR